MRRAQPFLWILCLCSAIATPAMADDMEFEERIRKLEQKLRDIEQEHRQPQGTASPATEGAESSPTSGGQPSRILERICVAPSRRLFLSAPAVRAP
jgi:hypothetical protein